ncbi:MAG: ASKHA domain-containing protein [Thermodesulfobacteriota bacterium]|nr:ASKHA domain-containing protein [Thermodesulfobacteriota bacterium]
MAQKLLLALDLGTTTLSGRLLTVDGEVCAEATLFNPQGCFGADVLRRMEAAVAGDGEALQQALYRGIDDLVTLMLEQCQAHRQDIVRAGAAGNPAISCLLQGLPVENLLYPPHRPVSKAAAWLHLEMLPVPLFLFPLVSGYVGGDLVAVLYAFADCAPGTFFVDVGTNGEMAVYNGEQWWVTSVAAGPAFEGGNIACGMVATTGAVTGVKLEQDRLQLQVRGDGLPRGLCGSGLVEAIAASLDGGLIDTTGTIVDADDVATNLSRYLGHDDQGRTLCLYRDAKTLLQLTQNDIRQFQLAKGAVYAGAQCLLARANMTAEDLDCAIVTGALGFSMGRDVLKSVAMLPLNMIEKVIFYDGGVIAGLGRYLMQGDDGDGDVQRLAESLHPYPLSGTPHFEQAFVAALNFPDLS